jgi:hypothetical protein
MPSFEVAANIKGASDEGFSPAYMLFQIIVHNTPGNGDDQYDGDYNRCDFPS